MPDPAPASSTIRSMSHEDAAGPFDWHPEPELVNYRDEATSAEPLLEAGFATWEAAIAYLYDEGLARGMGRPTGYAELRRLFFDGRDDPGPAPKEPTPWSDLLGEWQTRLAPHLMNTYHPRTWGYFTPPPLMASVLGELLAQVAHQGI